MSWWLQISAGQGPAECQWVVARLAEQLLAAAAAAGSPLKMLERLPGDQPGTFRSVLLGAAAGSDPAWAAGWLGTIRWIGRSPFRPQHQRRNWFAGVALLQPPERPAWRPDELKFETSRAGGPGGQHVNKVESAVRVIHLPTGLSASAREERSQHQNRRLALARLAEQLDNRGRQAASQAATTRWAEHHSLERGNARRTYRGAGFELENDAPGE
jgi:peptide chain release factor